MMSKLRGFLEIGRKIEQPVSQLIANQVVYPVIVDPANHIMLAYGANQPATNTPGFAAGALFLKNPDGASGGMYVNSGNHTNCTFAAVGSISGASVLPGNMTLANATIIIGNATNVGVERTMSGNATISNTGVITIGAKQVAASQIALAQGKIFIGASGGAAAAQTPSGNVTVSDAGVMTIGEGQVGANMISCANGKIIIGDANNLGAAQTPSGDVTITNAGVTAIGANKVLPAMIDPSALKVATVTVSHNDIIGSATVIKQLVAAPGANNFINFISAVLSYSYADAAYGAGGNLSIAANGTSLSGIVSAANSLGASGNKVVQFVPLATAGINLELNKALDLKTDGQFTNGSANGTAKVYVTYQVLAK